MYNQIPEKEYSYYQQKYYKQIGNYSLEEKDFFGYYTFKIIKQVLKHFVNDYAAYRAHYEKWKNTGNRLHTIHFGLNVVQEFVSFWDYIGYDLNMIFELRIKNNEVNFSKAVDSICKKFNGKLRRLTIELKNLFEEDKNLRDYRNEFVHRFHSIYFRNNAISQRYFEKKII
ncbi:MAG: hypothetical protein ACOCP4_06295 [Candidatus Woesearchaeota archaeon]